MMLELVALAKLRQLNRCYSEEKTLRDENPEIGYGN
jgi:hypothetical protein